MIYNVSILGQLMLISPLVYSTYFKVNKLKNKMIGSNSTVDFSPLIFLHGHYLNINHETKQPFKS